MEEIKQGNVIVTQELMNNLLSVVIIKYLRLDDLKGKEIYLAHSSRGSRAWHGLALVRTSWHRV